MANRNSLIRRRALFVLGSLGLAATLLVGRLVYLQVFQAGKLSAMAEAQRTKTVDLSAVRGEIVDANGKELAVSVEAWSIYAMPREVKDFDPKETAAKLAPALEMTPAELEKALQGSHFRWLKRKVTPAMRDAMRKLAVPGIGSVRETRRVYPKGPLAATLLGFVGIDNQGLAGIEHAFDKVLKGPEQKLRVQVDAYGREILREGSHDPVDTLLADGNKVILTIDENIQHIAERELAKSMVSSGAKRGAVMMMEVATGNLVAFAINPTFDPNQFGKYGWGELKNWAVTDVYEPGSTFKIFTVAAALELKRITPGQTFFCPPYIKVDGRVVSDHDFPKARDLTPFGILEESSNVGTTKISFTMTTKEHREQLEKMGFGRLSGSGITGEQPGVLHKLPWRPLSQATISYGQGISVTPLQILAAAGAVGNKGIRMTPRLIDKIVTAKGELIESFPPKPQGQVMRPETAAMIMKMLEQVVTEGTGKSAGVPGYRIAGKTGTAEKVRDDGRGYSREVIASFLGYFPADKPRFVMQTLLDSPSKVHWASLTASPLFSAVAGDTLRYLAITPTEPSPKPSHKPIPKPSPKSKVAHETL